MTSVEMKFGNVVTASTLPCLLTTLSRNNLGCVLQQKMGGKKLHLQPASQYVPSRFFTSVWPLCPIGWWQNLRGEWSLVALELGQSLNFLSHCCQRDKGEAVTQMPAGEVGLAGGHHQSMSEHSSSLEGGGPWGHTAMLVGGAVFLTVLSSLCSPSPQ